MTTAISASCADQDFHVASDTPTVKLKTQAWN